MKVLDLFSGIGGFSLAAERAGCETVAFSEIEPFPCRLLAERWPNVPNLGDVTQITGQRVLDEVGPIDVITAGFPCQDLSVAGKRAGLEGERSGLYWQIVRLVSELIGLSCPPEFLVLENVPGLLSADGGESDDEQFRCVCGWPRGRGWVHLGSREAEVNDAGAHGSAEVHALQRPNRDAQPIPGGIVRRCERDEGMASIGGSRSQGTRADEDTSTAEGGTSRPRNPNLEAAGVGRGDYAETVESGSDQRSPISGESDFGLEPEFDSDAGLFAWETDCPACGRRAEEYAGGVVRPSAMGIVLGTLAQLGAVDVAYRVLDAQHFGVAQRRRRVFIVADFAGRRAEQVLLEPESLRRDSAPGRKAGEDVARALTGSLDAGGGNRGCGQLAETGQLVARPLATGTNGQRYDYETETFVTHTLRGEGFDASEDGTGGNPPAICFDETQITSAENRSNPQPGDPSHPLAAGARPPTLVMPLKDPGGKGAAGSIRNSIHGNTEHHGIFAQQVRRLTPTECERLQGYPDGWTDLDGAADGPRYRALGNSVAVPCVEWILRRIVAVTVQPKVGEGKMASATMGGGGVVVSPLPRLQPSFGRSACLALAGANPAGAYNSTA